MCFLRTLSTVATDANNDDTYTDDGKRPDEAPHLGGLRNRLQTIGLAGEAASQTYPDSCWHIQLHICHRFNTELASCSSSLGVSTWWHWSTLSGLTQQFLSAHKIQPNIISTNALFLRMWAIWTRPNRNREKVKWFSHPLSTSQRWLTTAGIFCTSLISNKRH